MYNLLPQRDSARPRRVATLKTKTSDTPQGGGSGPVPTSKPQEDWLCDGSHKYFELKPPKPSLEMCNKALHDSDHALCRKLTEEINFLMVVSGLFLGIVTAFTVQTYPQLQEDKQDKISDLLVRLLNNTNAQENSQPLKSFAPDPHIIVINQLWFSSITLNLFTVIMGTFCLQWISAFLRGSDLNDKSIPPDESLALRQLRFEGIGFWGVVHAPEILLFTVQVSIGLFASGLIYFLWNISHRAALPALVLASIAGALLSIANLMPFLQPLLGLSFRKLLTIPQCPYKSPSSWLAHSIFACLIKPFQNTGPFEDLLLALPLPFTDYLWKKYDRMCAHFRELLPSGHSRLRYFGLGLQSALHDLADDADTIVTIGHCCEALQPLFKQAKDWENFSQETLSCDEKGFLDEKYDLQLRFLPRRLNTPALQLGHMSNIRADFLNALILQYLAAHNVKLARILFRHRVELYIRIKNSTRFILRSGNFGFDFGKSLHCPTQCGTDILILDADLRFQLLSCINRLIYLGRATDNDILSAATIVLTSARANTPGITPPLSPAQKINPTAHETSHFDNQPIEVNTSGNYPELGEPGMEPSPPNDVDKPGQQAGDTNEKDTHSEVSFETLCPEVLQQLVLLEPSDFDNFESYVELRQFLDLPAPS